MTASTRPAPIDHGSGADNGLVVVTGANGRLGTAVCAALRQARYRVAGIVRSSDGTTALDETLPIAGFDHLPVPSGTPIAVIHLTAEVHDPARMFEVNVRGSEHMIEWAVVQRCRRFIYMSSVGVYGARRKGTITIETPYAPANEYERTKALAEVKAREADTAGRISVTVLQPSIVFGIGPRWQNPLLGFIRSITRGRFVYPGRRDGQLNCVDVRDVATACVSALRPEAAGRTFIVNDPLPLPDAVDAIATAAGVTCRRRRVPYGAAWGLAATLEIVGRVTGRRGPFDLERLQYLTNRTVYDGSPIRSQLGFTYPVGTARGLGDLVRHYRALSLI